jgi:hypothetical protein
MVCLQEAESDVRLRCRLMGDEMIQFQEEEGEKMAIRGGT